MAAQTATVADIHRGLHSSNIVTRIATFPSLANGDTLEATFSDLAGKGMILKSVRAMTIGAGAIGARTHTGPAVTLTVTSYDEATGKLVLTNGTGGALAGFYAVVEFYAVDLATPA